MKTLIVGLSTVVIWSTVGDVGARAQEVSEEHQWLQRLVGDWSVTTEARLGPDTDPVHTEGSESIRGIGNLWILAEGSAIADGQPFTSIFTIGYDPAQNAFVATWVDSVQTRMWSSTGSLDPTGTVLTLEAEGPSVGDPRQPGMYRETIEVLDDDHKVTTSSVQLPDGSWFEFARSDSRRKD